MHRSKIMKSGLFAGCLALILGGPVVAWNMGQMDPSIDPGVERACHDAVKSRAPGGYRSIMTFEYDEEGTMLGLVRGSLEASYAPSKWTQVAWTCRINLEDQQVIRLQVQPTTGGQRLKAAASAF